MDERKLKGYNTARKEYMMLIIIIFWYLTKNTNFVEIKDK